MRNLDKATKKQLTMQGGKAKKNPEDYAGQTTHHKETEGNSRESEDIANAD